MALYPVISDEDREATRGELRRLQECLGEDRLPPTRLVRRGRGQTGVNPLKGK